MPTKTKVASAAGTVDAKEIKGLLSDPIVPQCSAARQDVSAELPEMATPAATQEWPIITKVKSQLAALRKERDDIKERESEECRAGRYTSGTTDRKHKLGHEIDECLLKLEQLEADRRRSEFKPCIDVHSAFIDQTRNRLKSHFDYLLELVDDADQQILCQAIELLKREQGTEEGYLQAGELIETMLFVIGAGTTKENG